MVVAAGFDSVFLTYACWAIATAPVRVRSPRASEMLAQTIREAEQDAELSDAGDRDGGGKQREEGDADCAPAEAAAGRAQRGCSCRDQEEGDQEPAADVERPVDADEGVRRVGG